jgi:hypothetical protein
MKKSFDLKVVIVSKGSFVEKLLMVRELGNELLIIRLEQNLILKLEVVSL